nr:helix-turn-helix domain-containing protein [uncultured Flavonifractor sp.]
MREHCRWRRRKRYGTRDDELSISDTSAYELMQEEDFLSLRIGKRIVVPKEELRRWISARTKRAQG